MCHTKQSKLLLLQSLLQAEVFGIKIACPSEFIVWVARVFLKERAARRGAEREPRGGRSVGFERGLAHGLEGGSAACRTERARGNIALVDLGPRE